MPILWEGGLPISGGVDERYDASIQPAPELAWKREGSDERGTYGRSDDDGELGDGLTCESSRVTEWR